MPKKQKQNELRSKIEEEFKKSCGEELGFVSAIFMSQGKIKAKDIVMPTTELEESVDRFGLYLFEAMEKLEDLYKQEIEGKRYKIIGECIGEARKERTIFLTQSDVYDLGYVLKIRKQMRKEIVDALRSKQKQNK